jgi:hypothetical protein
MPSDPAPWNGWTIMASEIVGIMAANGDADKKVWMTEYGAPTNEVSNARQADMMREAYRLSRDASWAGPLFWYGYRDLGTDRRDREQNFGIISHSGQRKAAYHTFRELARTGG